VRHTPIKNTLFKSNRERLRALLKPKSVAFVNANDLPPANADAVKRMHPNSDLFYLSGIEQEESILMLAPDAVQPALREVLFVREPNPHLKIWEGEKHSQENATKLSGIKEIKWLSELPAIRHQIMCQSEQVYLNSNEHPRAVVDVQSREARFIHELQQAYPLHRYERLAPLMHALREIKSAAEVNLIKQACAVTRDGFLRVLDKTRPGITEYEIEAEFAHEFTRNRCQFAYSPIVASGADSCVLHYLENQKTCRKGDVLLLDVGACYGNYNADMTRTIPVSGKFTRRQKQVYQAVLRVQRAMIAASTVGKSHLDWQQEAELMMNDECLALGLITKAQIKRETPDRRACRKYFMHGLGHSLGLDVHDVTTADAKFADGWVITVEPGIYIPEENFGIRLENNILITEEGPVDLMADIPIEPDEIQSIMAAAKKRF
jgi:Xaa-Pro aminopeptidase